MPSDPLPDFAAVDVALLASTATHTRLAAVSAELLAWWPTADRALAAYNDSPPPKFGGCHGRAPRRRSADSDGGLRGDRSADS